MSIEQQRWTLYQVVTAKGPRWTYELRRGGCTTGDWPTSKAAAKAAERAWKSRRTELNDL